MIILAKLIFIVAFSDAAHDVIVNKNYDGIYQIYIYFFLSLLFLLIDLLTM